MAGADFQEKDGFKKASWAKGACIIKCVPKRNRSRAKAVCELHEKCVGLDVNVEGTVATLKA